MASIVLEFESERCQLVPLVSGQVGVFRGYSPLTHVNGHEQPHVKVKETLINSLIQGV